MDLVKTVSGGLVSVPITYKNGNVMNGPDDVYNNWYQKQTSQRRQPQTLRWETRQERIETKGGIRSTSVEKKNEVRNEYARKGRNRMNPRRARQKGLTKVKKRNYFTKT